MQRMWSGLGAGAGRLPSMRPSGGATHSPGAQSGFQLNNFAGRIKALSIVWFVYGGLVPRARRLGAHLCQCLLPRRLWSLAAWPLGTWSWGPEMFWPAILRFGWAMVVVRSALAFAAGWGLMERTAWGRIVAIVASFLFLLKIPIGTALGIWTLVTLLGYRNTTLYDQLQ